MEGDSPKQQQLAEIFGLAACLIAKNLAWWYYSRGDGSRNGTLDGTGSQVGRIERIIVYPVKSCSGVELRHAEIGSGGLVAPGGLLDRSYLVLSEPDEGRFVSLKNCPRLSAVRPQLDPERLGAIRLTAEGHPTLAVSPTQRSVRIRFRSETLTGLDCGDEVAAWLDSVCASRGFRLAHCPRGERQEAMPKRMRQIGDSAGADAVPVNPIAFADASPILLLSDRSIQHLNERLAQESHLHQPQQQPPAPVDWRNFRPNLVVSGADQPHAEDTWGRVRIGDGGAAQLSVAFPCERCMMVNLTYSEDGLAKAPQGNPVLGALAPYRSWRPFRNPLFGANCAVISPGPVAIGDRVFATAAAKTK